MLGVIDKGSSSDTHPVPLLFVHGTGHGAWSWDEHFLGFFSERGYRAVALNMRGHGRSATSKPLRSCSVSDFVDDVTEVADSLPVRPAVIGHSLGGYVVQKYLETNDAPAGVLISSLPPGGSMGMTLRRIRRHPWLFVTSILTGKQLPGLTPPPLAREAFFSPHTPEEVVVRCAARLQEESAAALAETMHPRGIRPASVRAPILVIGAECDGGVSRKEVRATALAYRTEAEIFPGMGHDMMLEPGWRAVAERIDEWLVSQGV
ncbi:alpha/beta hydrolase [Mycolicibacterium sp. 018/SC-01/001]|uniref:alpha/beta hydrolase n=1 Tax=Mycolicibacterium sp. 018/SC-01/001 TaxID=2592069 RepID=UPI00117F241A|nr:alpha/beta hydrolase [Mycolicibacterium sp. 018/SC-01/001]TRW82080.1 alpha/beta hydrolase [Mycolicibacterium sp. 018/SC-01/001]